MARGGICRADQSSSLGPSFADEPLTFQLSIRDHRFEPSELRVPAGKPLVIKVRNLDATPEEIESSALKIEKVIAGGAEGIVRSRGLAAGHYEFEGEYHGDTAKGVIIAE